MSNPFRPGDPVNWTTYAYDALGRSKQVQQPDGNTINTGYSGPTSTVTDEAGKQKRYTYDALGRLLNVNDDPSGANYTTDYRYDALDNLWLVSQGYCGSCQQRYFYYDGLSRLTSASNPESGTTSYDYYANGNLWHKTDNRHITTIYLYDGLNRITQKSYNDTTIPGYTTPTVNYQYDDPSVANSQGRLTAVSGTRYTAYDAFGHVTASTQDTGGHLYNFSYAYNLAGDLIQETYPSGRTVTTDYDSGDRPWRVHGGLPGQPETWYVPQVQYAAHGAPSYMSYGNNLVRRTGFNSRLQPSLLWDKINDDGGQFLFEQNPICWGNDADQSCDAGTNNGNVIKVAEWEGGPGPWYNLTPFWQHYRYDGVNRLQNAWEDNQWWRNYSYDSWGLGHWWVSGGGSLNPSPLAPQSTSNIDLTTNRLVGNNAGYDAAGNQTQLGAVSLQYDAENRQWTSADAGSGSPVGITYVYDGQGQRVAKLWQDGSRQVIYIYDAFGQLAAEYQSNPAGAPPCRTCYISRDYLGSVRLVTNEQTQVIARHDYLPYGEEIYGGQAGRDGSFGAYDGLSQRFTGQERDGETTPNLDFFQARYYSGEQGRFLSPDPGNAGADLYNPRSWNGYSYAWSNPLTNTDPSGMFLSAQPYGGTSDGEGRDFDWNLYYQWIFGGQSSGTGGSPQPPGPAQQMQSVLNAVSNWLTAPRDMNCVQRAAVAGAAAGAVSGAIAGGVGGGAAGGTLGSIVPVAGTAAGAAGGGALGTEGGAALGGGAGYLGGLAAGYLTCASSTGGGSSGGGNDDFQTKNTIQRTANFRSEGEARATAQKMLGKNPIKMGNKWRSADGVWQYRAKPGDVGGGHIHLERLDPSTGEVLENWHFNWPEGAGR